MEFRARIKELREEANLSLTELGALFGKSESACRSWELGRTKPDADTVIALSAYFDVTSDYLLGISGYRKIEDREQLREDANNLLENLKKYAFGGNYIKATNDIIRLSENLCKNENIWFFSSSIILLIGDILSTISFLVSRSDDNKSLSPKEMITALEEIVDAKEILDGCVGSLLSESLKSAWEAFERHNPEEDRSALAFIFSGLSSKHEFSNKYIIDKMKHLKEKQMLREGGDINAPKESPER